MMDFLNNCTFGPHLLVSFLFLTYITFPTSVLTKVQTSVYFFANGKHLFIHNEDKRLIFEKHRLCFVGFSPRGETEHHFLILSLMAPIQENT